MGVMVKLSRATSLILLLCCWAATARADYKQSFREGIKAADLGKWNDVAASMRAAIAEKSVEGEKILIYGMRYEPYLPYYYLGLAAYRSQDCAGAISAFEKSEQQAGVKRSPQYKTLQKFKAECEQRIGKIDPPKPIPTDTAPPVPRVPDISGPLRAAEEEIGKAESAAKNLSDLRRQRDLELIWNENASLAAKERSALEGLTRSRSRLESGKQQKDAGPLSEAKKLAESARGELESIGAELNRASSAKRQALMREIEGTTARARQLLREPASNTTSAAVPKADLEKVIAQRNAIGASSSIAQLNDVNARLKNAVAVLAETLRTGVTPPPDRPPAELVAAVRTFFEGNYGATVSVLQTAKFASARASAQGHLFLAAARYSLFAIGGEKDSALKQQAMESVRAAKRLEPSLTPHADAFSPRFVQFFREISG